MAKKEMKRDVRIVAPAIAEDDPMTKDPTEYVTTRQAAEMMGVNRFWIVRLLTEDRLKGKKLGHDWLVFVPSIESYQQTKSKRGRPPSGSPKLPEKDNGQG